MRSGFFIVFFCVLAALHTTLLAQETFPATNNTNTNPNFSDTSLANTPPDNDFLAVEKAYVLNSEFTEAGVLRLNWQIADGYFLYRHAFKIALTDGKNIINPETVIPPGKKKLDELFGNVEVFYHSTDITLNNIPASKLLLKVTSQGCADAGLCYPPYTQYFELDGTTLTSLETSEPAALTTITAASSINDSSLVYMIFLAILGGTILNLMPCVFPVLSLKVLAFAKDKDHSHTIHGLVYSSGVVLSFVAVAAILISLQAAGEIIGWGFHLQSPWFVATLTYLFFIMGLSLSGFIELGTGWMGAGDKLTQKPGYTGSFFTGVLATVVASPCTAPFMGTALGFAITQSPAIALLIFAALGFGMSLPLLILSFSPALLNKIPKPGPWMEKLKEILAFPLYATAVWLCWVAGNQVGVNGMAVILLGCILIALALWLWKGKPLSRIVAVGCAVMAIIFLTGPFLSTNKAAEASHLWQAYTPSKLAQLRKQNKAVFINITADWCITCLANEKVTLNTERFTQSINELGFTYLKGDLTNHDPAATQLLNEYKRTGIPLYLVYPADGSQRAEVLPQILSIETVIDALERAAQQKPQQ